MENLSCMHKALGLILNIKWNNKRSKKPFDPVSATSCSNLTSVFLAQNMNVLKESTGSLPNLCTQRHSCCWSKTSVAIRSGSRDLCCSPRLHSDRLTECDHSYRPLWSCHFDKCFQLTAIPAALTSLAPGQGPEMLLLSIPRLSLSQMDFCDTSVALTVSPITEDINKSWYLLHAECTLKPSGQS